MTGNHKAALIFRGLFASQGGSFESDVGKALDEWSLRNTWNALSGLNIGEFKRKVKRIAKRQLPDVLKNDGRMSWLYQNFCSYSGNMPSWADWNWKTNNELKRSEPHFVALVTGSHPVGGHKATCCHVLCRCKPGDSVYNHHFFECSEKVSNRIFFINAARGLFMKSKDTTASVLRQSVLEAVLEKPSPMWVGLVDQKLFLSGLKLRAIHELHRILTMASICSWSRFYTLPIPFS